MVPIQYQCVQCVKTESIRVLCWYTLKKRMRVNHTFKDVETVFLLRVFNLHVVEH